MVPVLLLSKITLRNQCKVGEGRSPGLQGQDLEAGIRVWELESGAQIRKESGAQNQGPN